MHFKILEIHFLEEKSGKNPAKFFETGPELEPDIEAGYPAGTRFSRIRSVPREEYYLYFHRLLLLLISH